jgi:N-carbamoylputrescine amidase
MQAPHASTFTLGLIQLHCEEDPDDNLERALSAVRRAAHNGAEIVCLPDLVPVPATGLARDDRFEQAEPIPGPTSERLAAAAREYKTVLVASLFERRAPGVYHDTAVVLDADGELRGLYRKMHITGDALPPDRFRFAPGDLGFHAFTTRFGRVGVLLGGDGWFPEAARLATLQGAEVLLYPAAQGWRASRAEDGVARRTAWDLLLRAHAVANGVYVAAVNRVGHEGSADSGLEFAGSSFVCDPLGEVVGHTSADREEVLVVPCDRRRLEAIRLTLPFFRDRRPDAYADLARRWLV